MAWLDAAILLALAIHLTGGLVAGSDQALRRGLPDPIALLGTTFDQAGCTAAPLEVGDGAFVICRDWSAVASPEGRALVVSMYGPDNAVIREFRGDLPQGLRWGDTITEVIDALGRPYRITDVYGTPTLVYMFEDERYGSLELRFNGADRLDAINACLTH